jgi:hypothetical protein
MTLPEIPEINDPLLTPSEQDLVEFLDELSTSPYSPELIDKGRQVMDAAVKERIRLDDTINSASKAINNVKKGNK